MRYDETSSHFVEFSEDESKMVGDVALGVHEQIARQADDAFIRPTASRRRQFWRGGVGDVNADYGKIAIGEFPNVGATTASGSLCTVRVRVLADASQKHNANTSNYG